MRYSRLVGDVNDAQTDAQIDRLINYLINLKHRWEDPRNLVVLHQKCWFIPVGVHLPKTGVSLTETGGPRNDYLVI